MTSGIIFICLRKGGPQIYGFYEPKTCWKSYWQVRPVQKEYQAYAVDGHGSDDFADYELYPVQMLQPYSSTKNDLEPPPTSRNLLGEEQYLEENKLDADELGEQILNFF